jgi:hypothetical protein
MTEKEMTEKEREAIKRFQEFEKSQPDSMTIRNGGVNGEDLVLYKKVVNGIPVYSAPLDVPLWGSMKDAKKKC